MEPKTISDFVPLAILTEEKLTAIKKIAQQEKNKIPEKHRIYWFNELLHVSLRDCISIHLKFEDDRIFEWSVQ